MDVFHCCCSVVAYARNCQADFCCVFRVSCGRVYLPGSLLGACCGFVQLFHKITGPQLSARASNKTNDINNTRAYVAKSINEIIKDPFLSNDTTGT